MSKPSRGQVAQCGRQADKIAQPLTHSWDVELCAIARADLEAQLAEQKQQLAECQATNGKLREALSQVREGCLFTDDNGQIGVSSEAQIDTQLFDEICEALALPNDSTALNELIAERTASLTAEVERLKNNLEASVASIDGITQQYELRLTADRSELTAQRDAAMKDAERYRWLRSEHAINDPMAAVVWKRNYDRKESEWVNTSDVHSLDRAIDAAIANCKEP